MIQKKKKTALIVEGGGMRGIFTAGVLDSFLRESFDPFCMYFGVSSGASTLSSFLAGQYGRHFRIFTKIACEPEFMSLKKAFSGGSYMDLDWLWNTVEEREPLNTRAIDRHLANRECYIVCTQVETGTPIYLTPKGRGWIETLKASSALPVLYRKFPRIDNEPLTDGGVMDPIPAMEAYNKGARRIVVIRTRPTQARKKTGLTPLFGSIFLKNYPNLRKRVSEQAERYNEAIRFLESPPSDVDIIQVAPNLPLRSGRTTRNTLSLVSDYQDGIESGNRIVQWLNTSGGPELFH